MTFESWFKTTLSKVFDASDTTCYVATAPTVTSGRMYATNWQQEEWFSYSWVSGSTLTGCVRGLSQTADPSTAWTWKKWIGWTVIKFVAMHDQIPDKQGADQILQESKRYATTAARDSALWGDWVATISYTGIVCDDTWLEYRYNLSTAQWEDYDTGTTTPNASTTAAGKVEVATDAEILAETDTGGTGAKLVSTPSQLSPAKLTDKTSAVSDDLIRIADSADTNAAKSIKINYIREAIPASATAKGTVELLTDAEAVTATDQTRYINVKQVDDNYWITIAAGTTNTLAEANTERSVVWTTYTKVKEIVVDRAGTYTVAFDLKRDLNVAYGRVYVWGVAFGTEQTGDGTYATKTENLTFANWDVVQLYLKNWDAGSETFARNFNIKYDYTFNYVWATVNTD